MGTTIALDDELVKQLYYTGMKEKAALVREALSRLVQQRGCPVTGDSRRKRPGG